MKYKVLTLWQPWATLLVYNYKLIETRPYPTTWTKPGCGYLIHAAKKWEPWQADLCFKEPFKSKLIESGFIILNKDPELTPFLNLPLGMIIGLSHFGRCSRIVQKLNWDIHRDERVLQIENMNETEKAFGDYREERYAWLTLGDSKVLKTPIPYKGGQGYYQDFKGDESQLIFK